MQHVGGHSPCTGFSTGTYSFGSSASSAPTPGTSTTPSVSPSTSEVSRLYGTVPKCNYVVQNRATPSQRIRKNPTPLKSPQDSTTNPDPRLYYRPHEILIQQRSVERRPFSMLMDAPPTREERELALSG